jgi:hypothetical protein
MIGVPGDTALGTKSKHDLRLEFPDLKCQIANYVVDILAMELPVRIVEHDSSRDIKNFAGRGKLFAADGSEFVIVTGAAPVGCSLAWGEADNASFYTAITVQTKRAAKAPGFIIRMGGDNHQAHLGDCTVLAFEILTTTGI